MNIAQNLENSARFFPEHTAVVIDGREISYSQFNDDTARIASSLATRGVKPGDHVAFCGPNSYEWLAVYFGALKTGAVAVTFSHLLTRQELEQILTDCRPKVLFTADEKLDDVAPIRQHAFLHTVIAERGDIGCTDLIAQGDAAFETVDRQRGDTAAVLYTGGTTGTPKGALLSHANIQAAIHNVAFYERSSQNDRSLCFLPLNHVFAQIHITHSTFYTGGGLVLLPAFDLDQVLHAVARFRVTKFYAVPTIYIRFLGLEKLKQKLSPIRYCFSAAASMARETVREWKKRTGLAIHEAYGMTESASMVTFNHYWRHVVGSVGTPASLVEVRIMDSDGNPVTAGQEGEICICGPNITSGYLNNPRETQAAFRGPWLRSGDIGYIDPDGYLFIVDRLKDMIITGGENVYPREIEELLYTRREIQECAVVGLPDAEYGERVTAFIVSSPGQPFDAALLKTFLKQCLAGFKIPKAFVAVDDLPKNNAGKLLKREIQRKFS